MAYRHGVRPQTGVQCALVCKGSRDRNPGQVGWVSLSTCSPSQGMITHDQQYGKLNRLFWVLLALTHYSWSNDAKHILCTSILGVLFERMSSKQLTRAITSLSLLKTCWRWRHSRSQGGINDRKPLLANSWICVTNWTFIIFAHSFFS